MKRADQAAGKFEASTKGVQEGLEQTETKTRGAVDLLDGLAGVFGFNADAALNFGRGIKDIADGLKTTFGPQIEAATLKIKAMSAAMTATPMGRFKLGLGLAAAAGLAFAASTDEGKNALDRLSDQAVKNATRTLGVFGDTVKWVDNNWGGFGQKLLKSTGWFKSTDKAVEESAARLANWAAQAQNAARAIAIAQQLGGTVDDPDGAFASAAAVAAAQVNMGEGISSAFQTGAVKATKSIKSGVDKMAKAATDAFAKVRPRLEAAAQKFQDAISLRDSIRGGFGLTFGDDIGHSVEEGLRRQVDRFKQFTAKIAALRKQGLDPGLINQFVDAGPGSLDELNRINSGNISTINDLAKQAGATGRNFSNAETLRRTGVDPTKPVKVTLDVKGGQKELVDLIKKWVRTEGGGSVQVAFK